MYDLTLITPTADQPTGIALAERYIARQTIYDTDRVQWIVSDDGLEPALLTMGQLHIYRTRPRNDPNYTGWVSLAENLLAALPHVRGRAVAIIEHDDRYPRKYLEHALGRLFPTSGGGGGGGADLTGESVMRYYHVGQRRYWTNRQFGSCLCQLTFKADHLHLFEWTIKRVMRTQAAKMIDYQFWWYAKRKGLKLDMEGLTGETSGGRGVVGIKGLPGRAGIGMGHRPAGAPNGVPWRDDPEAEVLRQWCGDDAGNYLRFYRR